MEVLVLLLIIIIFYKSKIFKKGFNEDYLSLESSKLYKGFLAIIILFHHISQKVNPNLLFYKFSYVGYLAVAVFFFISGYGTHKSNLKSDKYRKKFLLNKFINILIPYIIVTTIYVIYNKVYCKCYYVENIFEYIINKNPIVSNSWYIIVLLVFSIMYYISMSIFKKRKNLIIIPMLLFNLIYIYYCKQNNFGIYWYDAIHLYNIGIIFAQYETKIIGYFKRTYSIILPILLLLFRQLFKMYYLSLEYKNHFIISIIIVLLFLLLNMKIKINNKLLEFFGKISYELYMVQGLFLDIFRTRIYNIQNDLYFALLVIVCSILSAYILNVFFSYTKKLLKSKKSL